MGSFIERKASNTINIRAKKNIPIEKILELHNQGYYDSEIAKIFGCKRHNITQRLNRAGITGRKSKINDIELRDRISKSLIGRYVGKITQIIRVIKMKTYWQEEYSKPYQKKRFETPIIPVGIVENVAEIWRRII